MTALAVQQNLHHLPLDHRSGASASHPAHLSRSRNLPNLANLPSSQPQSTTHAAEAPTVARGGSAAMPSRLISAETADDASPAWDSPQHHDVHPTATSPEYDAESAVDRRPSSAPGNRQNAAAAAHTNGAVEHDRRNGHPAKPLLLRSKSEHGLRPEESTNAEHSDDEFPAWGVRHGFEENYNSEDISNLADVRPSNFPPPLRPPPFTCLARTWGRVWASLSPAQPRPYLPSLAQSIRQPRGCRSWQIKTAS